MNKKLICLLTAAAILGMTLVSLTAVGEDNAETDFDYEDMFAVSSNEPAPFELKEIGTQYDDSMFYEINEDGESVRISDCLVETEGHVIIPGSIDGMPVTAIGPNAFEGCSLITGITIPDSVTKIGNNAFISCSALQSVIIPDGVTAIEASTFYGCASLSDVTIPANVTNIGESAFDGCSSLTSIDIPDKVIYIGNGAFEYSGLESITIPDSVTEIGEMAFNDCRKMADITIGSGVKSIGDSAFLNCLLNVWISDVAAWCAIDFDGRDSNPINNSRKLYISGSEAAHLVIPLGTSEIKPYAFVNCRSIKQLTISQGLSKIDYYAFFGCSNIEEILFPKSLVEVARGAFNSCNAIEKVAYRGTEEEWENVSIQRDNLPLEQVSIIYDYPFDDITTTPAPSPSEEPSPSPSAEAESPSPSPTAEAETPSPSPTATAPTPSPSPSASPSPSPSPTPNPYEAIDIYKDKVTVNVKDAGNAYNVVAEGTSLPSMKLYLAEYNGSNALIRLSEGRYATNNTTDKFTATINKPQSENYKLMLWDHNQRPVIKAVTNIE